MQDQNKLNDKLVIVINGKGGSGKDTICEIVDKYFNTMNISSITPIKEIARQHGWNGEKDLKSRKFLADLKKVFTEFNNLPTRYLLDEVEKFKNSDDDILFVHIREPEQIDQFKNMIDLKCITLLITSPIVDNEVQHFGNTSDDDVENYQYDYKYLNSKPLGQPMTDDFMSYFMRMLEKEFK